MSKYDFYFETEGVVTLVDKMDFFWVLPGGGRLFQTSLVEECSCLFNYGWLGLLASVKLHMMNWMVHITNLMIWKHFGGTKDWPRCHCSHFVKAVA